MGKPVFYVVVLNGYDQFLGSKIFKYCRLFLICMFVCLFVSYKSISQKRKICISTFFRKKEISIFTISHIEFYLAIYNLWLLLIMGFGPVGGRGGVYPGAASGGRGQSIDTRQGKSSTSTLARKIYTNLLFFQKNYGRGNSLRVNPMGGVSLRIKPRPLQAVTTLCNAAISASVSFFLFLIFFFLQSTHSAYLRGITFRPQSKKNILKRNGIFFLICTTLSYVFVTIYQICHLYFQLC